MSPLYAKEIRSAQPHGPYHIGGWCAAGPLAVETARQILESGEEVAMVVLFDSWRPGYAAELAVQQKHMPEMTLRARLDRKLRFHRGKLQPLSPRGQVKYAWNAIRAEGVVHTWQALSEALGICPAALSVSRATAAAFHAQREPANLRIHPHLQRPVFFRTHYAHSRHYAIYIPGAEPACGWGALASKGVERSVGSGKS